MLRWIYAGMLQLHPAPFRSRFGDEMLEIFECAPGPGTMWLLIADGLVSLIRQWLKGPVQRDFLAARVCARYQIVSGGGVRLGPRDAPRRLHKRALPAQ
jgi:hypothetical protein